MRQETFTIPEFVQHLNKEGRGHNNKKGRVEDNRSLSKWKKGYNLTNDRAIKAFVFLVAATNYTSVAYAEGLDQLNPMFDSILGVLRQLGYFVCVALCIKDIIECAINGGSLKEIGKVVVTYFIILASLYFVPIFFGGVPSYFGY